MQKNLEQGPIFGAKPEGFGFPHRYFLSSHPPAPRAVKRHRPSHIAAVLWEDGGVVPTLEGTALPLP